MMQILQLELKLWFSLLPQHHHLKSSTYQIYNLLRNYLQIVSIMRHHQKGNMMVTISLD
jgi:hypothetical protein